MTDDKVRKAVEAAAAKAGIAIPPGRRAAIASGAAWLRDCVKQIETYLGPKK
jgi:hypothetical protein